MKNLFIFRHGHTFATWNNTDYGEKIVSANIVTEGIPVIEKVANYLKTVNSSLCFSSEFLRCKETVEIVSKISGKSFTFDKRLNELLEENIEEFTKRILSFLDYVSITDCENIIICTHGAVISALRHIIIEKKVNKNDLVDFPQPGVLVIIKNSKIEEIDFSKKQ